VDRDLVLAVGIAAYCGPLLLLLGSIRAFPRRPADERTCWNALWHPVIPAVIVLAALGGWALQEPAVADEAVTPILTLIAAPFALIWLRAAGRALRALLATTDGVPAATVGLFRPRVVIAPELVAALETEALHAAREHEAAHARHRDPLRIWLAQLLTDMQWPSPAAGDRFHEWMHALEIARDDEARARGVDGAELAAAIITAERLRGRRTAAAAAHLTGDGQALKERIERLLLPIGSGEARVSRPRLFWLVFCVGCVAALLLGAVHGDAIVRALPGVAT
jgi:hypothetical protein